MVDNSRAGLIGRITIIAIYLWFAIDIATFAVGATITFGNDLLPPQVLDALTSASSIGMIVCGLLFFVWVYRAMSIAQTARIG